MMIEKDEFNRQLIHSYGARGVALVRLLEEKEDSDEVGNKNHRFLYHLAVCGPELSLNKRQQQQHKMLTKLSS
jgi:Na+-transporting NADH:ubiquinone oxidoreductase subunit NqrF